MIHFPLSTSITDSEMLVFTVRSEEYIPMVLCYFYYHTNILTVQLTSDGKYNLSVVRERYVSYANKENVCNFSPFQVLKLEITFRIFEFVS